MSEHFEKELKLEPHSLIRTTLCGILKDSDKIMNTDYATEYRDRKAAHLEELEACFFKWFRDQRDHHIVDYRKAYPRM